MLAKNHAAPALGAQHRQRWSGQHRPGRKRDCRALKRRLRATFIRRDTRLESGECVAMFDQERRERLGCPTRQLGGLVRDASCAPGDSPKSRRAF